MAILANNNTHTAIASGQYVYVRGHSTLTEGLYKATAAVAANGTLSTSNLTAVSNGGLNALNSKKMDNIIEYFGDNYESVQAAVEAVYESMANGEIKMGRFGIPMRGMYIAYRNSANYGAVFVFGYSSSIKTAVWKRSEGNWSEVVLE